MKIRMLAFCFALISAFATANAFAQDCAPCAAAGDVSCAPCATCATCVGRSCELFGGLRSLLACRPCVVSDVPVGTCGVPAASACGPIVSTNLPSCDVPSCGSCGTCGQCEAAVCVPAPVCGGEMFPYLKPCLYNAVHRPVNGVCKIVHGVFGALADVTTPTSDAGFFKPAYVKEICCGTCGEATCGGTCGPIETAPQPCMPAMPSCK